MRKTASPCRKLREIILVEVNGDCSFCCFIIRPGGKIGNLAKNDFEDIWNSRKARRIRRAIARGVIPYCCQICPYHGRFEHEKSRVYRAYFFGRKIMDAVIDYAQGGFTQNRLRRFVKITRGRNN